jgi:hypothetical protein
MLPLLIFFLPLPSNAVILCKLAEPLHNFNIAARQEESGITAAAAVEEEEHDVAPKPPFAFGW